VNEISTKRVEPTREPTRNGGMATRNGGMAGMAGRHLPLLHAHIYKYLKV